MAYREYLKSCLRPLGIYDLDSGCGADEIACEGAAMDGVYDELSRLDTARCIDTMSDTELREYEKLFPFTACGRTLPERRAAVKALLGTVNRCMTLKELNRSLPACGIAATAYETQTAQTIKIVFTDPPTDESLLAKIKSRVEMIVPCHLAIVYE